MSTPNTPRPGAPRPAGNQESRPSGTGRPAARPAGKPASSGQETTGSKPAQARPAPQKPAGSKPAPTAAKPAGQRPAAAKPAGQRPAGARPTGQQQKLVRPAPKAKVRKARLLVSKLDPWSVLKLSFLLSVALGIVTVVAAVVLWTVLDLTGVFDSVNNLLSEIAGSESSFNLAEIASLGQVAAFATIIAVVNVVLITAISTLAGVLYNISASLVGGIGVTLTDD
ncbi:DUF3566 domain-containing protein [Zhihengliuella halotolerans]|uniref:Transmembrane protein DUF3566 n=1 Tax=Zhihengliuella halotolerans TaxID=370736 RepID=A0A4V2GA75_9MICC|nr:DUF3566 domain-containing protein [Zhihengliuella halotolerans]RZU63166.1 transmembrane protein DUF3566 [Zhihengliuella halotolerans]